MNAVNFRDLDDMARRHFGSSKDLDLFCEGLRGIEAMLLEEADARSADRRLGYWAKNYLQNFDNERGSVEQNTCAILDALEKIHRAIVAPPRNNRA